MTFGVNDSPSAGRDGSHVCLKLSLLSFPDIYVALCYFKYPGFSWLLEYDDMHFLMLHIHPDDDWSWLLKVNLATC